MRLMPRPLEQCHHAQDVKERLQVEVAPRVLRAGDAAHLHLLDDGALRQVVLSGQRKRELRRVRHPWPGEALAQIVVVLGMRHEVLGVAAPNHPVRVRYGSGALATKCSRSAADAIRTRRYASAQLGALRHIPVGEPPAAGGLQERVDRLRVVRANLAAQRAREGAPRRVRQRHLRIYILAGLCLGRLRGAYSSPRARVVTSDRHAAAAHCAWCDIARGRCAWRC